MKKSEASQPEFPGQTDRAVKSDDVTSKAAPSTAAAPAKVQLTRNKADHGLFYGCTMTREKADALGFKEGTDYRVFNA